MGPCALLFFIEMGNIKAYWAIIQLEEGKYVIMTRRPKELGKTIYLPPIYDPNKIREGILEILYLVETYGTKPKDK